MNKHLKRKIIAIFIVVSAFFIGYGGYLLYNRVVEDITRKVRQSASRGVIDAFNPLKWPGKIFGGKKNKSDD
jgi:hypothetical protein